MNSCELAHPLSSASHNSLLGEIGLVLALDSECNETLQLLFLDALHLEAFVLDALANLSTLLKVVKAVLLLRLRVHADLVAKQL